MRVLRVLRVLRSWSAGGRRSGGAAGPTGCGEGRTRNTWGRGGGGVVTVAVASCEEGFVKVEVLLGLGV